MALTIESDVEVPMRDGTRLRADVYRPAQGRWPVLVQRTPYGKQTMAGTFPLLDPLRAARSGYAVVIQDVRGRGRSRGEFYPFVNEAADGQDTIAWAASERWSNGRVGMYGSSYMAATQWQAALGAPPSLQAIAPIQASADYYEGRSYRGGAFELGSLLTLSLWALGEGTIARLAVDATAKRAMRRAAREFLANLVDVARAPSAGADDDVVRAIAPFFLDWLAHTDYDEFWARIAVDRRYQEVTVPALHVSSWYDQYLPGTLRNFRGMTESAGSSTARSNQYLLVGPWSHYPARTSLLGGARVGEVNFGLEALVDLDGIQLAWFHRWLKDDDTHWRFRAPCRIFVMGSNAWRDLERWPPSDVLDQPWFLHGGGGANSRLGDGTLSTEPPGEEPPDRFVFDPSDPVPTRGGAHLILECAFPQGPFDQRTIEERSDVLVYTSAPLTEMIEVIGQVTVRLWVSTSAPCTDFTARLIDVHPDGRAMNVCDGIRRASFARSEDVVEIVIDLAATAQTFFSGHAIRLEISSSSSPRYDVNPNTGQRGQSDQLPVRAQQTIWHEKDAASHVLLPVVEMT
jgi:putative CocE/NonD family hydrolase